MNGKMLNESRRYRVLPLEARHTICLEVSKTRRQRVATSIFLPKDLNTCENSPKSNNRLKREKNVQLLNKKSGLLKNLNYILPTSWSVCFNKKNRKTKFLACFQRSKMASLAKNKCRLKVDCNGQQLRKRSKSICSLPSPMSLTKISSPAAKTRKPSPQFRRCLKHSERCYRILNQRNISQNSIGEGLHTACPLKPSMENDVIAIPESSKQKIEQKIQLATGQSCIISYSVELPQDKKIEHSPSTSEIDDVNRVAISEEITVNETRTNDRSLVPQKDIQPFQEISQTNCEKTDLCFNSVKNCGRLHFEKVARDNDSHLCIKDNDILQKSFHFQKGLIPCNEFAAVDQIDQNNQLFCTTKISNSDNGSSVSTETGIMSNSTTSEYLRLQHMLRNYPRWVPYGDFNYSKKENTPQTSDNETFSIHDGNLWPQNEPRDLRISRLYCHQNDGTVATPWNSYNGCDLIKHQSLQMTINQPTRDNYDIKPFSSAGRNNSKPCQSSDLNTQYRPTVKHCNSMQNVSPSGQKTHISCVDNSETMGKCFLLQEILFQRDPGPKAANTNMDKNALSLPKNSTGCETFSTTFTRTSDKRKDLFERRLPIHLNQSQPSCMYYNSAHEQQQQSISYQAEEKKDHDYETLSINNYPLHQQKRNIPSKLEDLSYRSNQEEANHRYFIVQQQQQKQSIVHNNQQNIFRQQNKHSILGHHYPLSNHRHHHKQQQQQQKQQQYALYSQTQSQTNSLLNNKQPLIIKQHCHQQSLVDHRINHDAEISPQSHQLVPHQHQGLYNQYPYHSQSIHNNLQEVIHQHQQQFLQQPSKSTAHHHFLHEEVINRQQSGASQQYPSFFHSRPHLKQAYNFLQLSLLNRLALTAPSSSAHNLNAFSR